MEGSVTSDSFARLFMALAEELKLPLQHIARTAELQQLQSGDGGAVECRDIQASADMTLQMLDSYLMSLRLCLQPATEMQFEPVSVPAVLHDVAGELQHIAASYGVGLRLHTDVRCEPVLTNRRALQSALVALGYTLIEALPAASARSQPLRLAMHRTKQGIVAGVYGELDMLSPKLLRRGRELQGQVRQPMVATMPGSGAGVFVADAILAAMESRLRVGRYMRLPGFAVTLPTSEQLQLV